MLRGFEWGLYLWGNLLVRAKLADFFSGQIFILVQPFDREVGSMTKYHQEYKGFMPIDFPEDARLGTLKIPGGYEGTNELVDLIRVYADEEIGGVYAEVLPAFSHNKKIIPLKEFLDDYRLVT